MTSSKDSAFKPQDQRMLGIFLSIFISAPLVVMLLTSAIIRM